MSEKLISKLYILSLAFNLISCATPTIEISDVESAEIYLDGGTVAVKGRTTDNILFTLRLPGNLTESSENIEIEHTYLDRSHTASDLEVYRKIILGLDIWMQKKLNGMKYNELVEHIFKVIPNVNESQAKLVNVGILLERICFENVVYPDTEEKVEYEFCDNYLRPCSQRN